MTPACLSEPLCESSLLQSEWAAVIAAPPDQLWLLWLTCVPKSPHIWPQFPVSSAPAFFNRNFSAPVVFTWGLGSCLWWLLVIFSFLVWFVRFYNLLHVLLSEGVLAFGMPVCLWTDTQRCPVPSWHRPLDFDVRWPTGAHWKTDLLVFSSGTRTLACLIPR